MTAETIRVFDNPQELAGAAADTFLERAREALDAGRPFAVALSGGSTPKILYQDLAARCAVDEETQDLLRRVDYFFGDERHVPPDHADSNYLLARNELFDPAGIPGDQVHRMHTENNVDVAARDYESELRRFFDVGGGEWPAFDLVFLGMGPDGHTASLFPRSDALGEARAFAAPNYVDTLHTHRVTLTAPVINHARAVLFLVTGSDKAETLNLVLNGPDRPENWPAQLIHPTEGELLWFVDREAASALKV